MVQLVALKQWNQHSVRAAALSHLFLQTDKALKKRKVCCSLVRQFGFQQTLPWLAETFRAWIRACAFACVFDIGVYEVIRDSSKTKNLSTSLQLPKRHKSESRNIFSKNTYNNITFQFLLLLSHTAGRYFGSRADLQVS